MKLRSFFVPLNSILLATTLAAVHHGVAAGYRGWQTGIFEKRIPAHSFKPLLSSTIRRISQRVACGWMIAMGFSWAAIPARPLSRATLSTAC